MKRDGPCKMCVIKPICSSVCENKIEHFTRTVLGKSKNVTFEDFVKQIRKEGFRITKVGLEENIIKDHQKSRK